MSTIDDAILASHAFRFGKFCVAVLAGWSWDFWGWTANNGDRHEDLFSLVIVKRREMRMLRLNVGPIMLMIAI